MIGWLHITLISTFSAVILVLLLLLYFMRSSLHPKTRSQYVTFQKGISMLHRVNPLDNLNTKCSIYQQFRWVDHPSLIADAVENGWSGFCFEMSSDCGDETNMEIRWEACEGSSDYYMQKVRLKRTITGLASSNRALSVIRTALPIPGPRFGNSFFPQQPYFEITIFSDELDMNNNNIELCEDESVLLTVGLTGGGHLSLNYPGCCPGSIGFNSSGSVYLNGTKLVLESETNKWARAENVIGCGYNPRHNRVFFTLNSQLAHEIYCKTEEFGHPLFPTVAANIDVTLVLNLGQSPFRFEPANSRRTPNPCSVRPQKEEYSAIGFEHSAELFSMGSRDSEWKHWPTITCIGDINDDYTGVECDRESLTDDLFEIHLVSTSGCNHS